MKRQFLGLALGVAAVLSASGADGDKAFEYDFGRPLQTAPAVDHDGTIYVGGSGAVAAVSSTGAELWKTELSTDSESDVGGITIGSDYIYVTSEEGLFAIDKEGTKVWTNEVNTASSMVALDVEGNLYVGTADEHLISLTPAGSVRWSEKLEAEIRGVGALPPPAVGLDGSVYVRGGMHALFAREPISGDEVWTEMVTMGNPGPLVFTEAGEMLVHEGGGLLYLVSTNGEASILVGNVPFFSAPPVVGPNGRIYLLPGFPGDRFNAWDENGDHLWDYLIYGQASPAVAEDGTIIVSGSNRIVAFSPTGMVKWSYSNNATVVQGITIAPAGTILAAEETGRLLALKGSSPLAKSGWPTFGGDAKHSFNKRVPVTIDTVVVSEVAETSATLTVEIHTAGRAADVYFELTAGDTVTISGAQAIAGGTAPVEVVTTVSNLVAGTFYSVAAVVSNSVEMVKGVAAPFQTLGGSGGVPPTLEALQGIAASGGTLTFSEPGTILISSPIDFLASAEIDGNGHEVVLSGAGQTSLLTISEGAEVTLKGLQLINGRSKGVFGPDGGVLARGGAILNLGGDLTLVDCVLSNNVAVGAQVEFGSGGGTSWPLPHGGSSELPANATGGAIWQEGGRLVVYRSTFIHNKVEGGLRYEEPLLVEAKGGAVYLQNAGATIRESDFHQNESSAITGSVQGGAIYSEEGWLHLEKTDIAANETGIGIWAAGAGVAVASGNLVLTNSIVRGNLVQGRDGQFLKGERGYPALGGGVYSAGWTRVYGSTFLTNQTIGGAGMGGGLSAGGGVYSSGELAVLNSTFAGNKSRTKMYNGNGQPTPWPGTSSAIYNLGTAGITNSTFAGNLEAEEAIGGTNSVSMINTLLAWNEGANGGTNVVDAGHNLSSDSTPSLTAGGSLNNVDPKLGTLGYYGGDTPVYPLLAGSPAIDAADDGAAPAMDQRRRVRPHGAHADIGAFESSPPFYVWGTIQGPHDSSTELTIGTEVVVPDETGYFDLGALPEGVTKIAVTATNTVFRPNPWQLDVTVDGPVNDLYAFKVHTFAFDTGYEEPVFTLAGEEGEIYLIEGSHDLESWSPVGTYTVDPTGLISLQITNEAKLFLRAIGE